MTKRKEIVMCEPDLPVKPIPGYEGLYSVSECGKIWSHAKSMGLSRHGGRWLKAGMATDGYLQVCLFKEQKFHNVRLHRAVAMAWIPNPSAYRYVNHINAVKTDCHRQNLEWCTKSHDLKHSWMVVRHPKRAHQSERQQSIPDTGTGKKKKLSPEEALKESVRTGATA